MPGRTFDSGPLLASLKALIDEDLARFRCATEQRWRGVIEEYRSIPVEFRAAYECSVAPAQV